jgi:hypothetical protein
VLYSFQGGSDGSTPAGGVVFDSAGNLYGANSQGGSGCPSGCGTVFELSPPKQKGGAWTETTIYEFKGFNGSNDGFTPAGGLIIDQQGNLYGTTGYGGTGSCTLLGGRAGCGIVYELSPPTREGGRWVYRILYSFRGGKDGYFPQGDLGFDTKGNIYGATQFGGGKETTCNILFGGQCGTVFELSPPTQKGGKWTEKVLHHFAGGTKGEKSSDGAEPNGGLVLDSAGAVYGTTYYGGNNSGACVGGIGCGTVFKLEPPKIKGEAWKEQVVFRLSGSDGANPMAGVILSETGDLYGGAQGGTTGGGVAFQLVAAGDGIWREAAVYEFRSNTYGYNPSISLFASSGDLYGTTFAFSDSGSGSVFRLGPPRKGKPWPITFLYEFTGPPDGISPWSSLVRDASGHIYGATQSGGSGKCGAGGCGMAFEIEP